jgi:hypothetical protein
MMSTAHEVSLSMLPNVSPAHPSAAVSRLQHRLNAEIAARRNVERENMQLRLQQKTLLRRLARRGERPAAVTPHTEASALAAPQRTAETVAAPVPNYDRGAELLEAVARASVSDGSLQVALREALLRRYPQGLALANRARVR